MFESMPAIGWLLFAYAVGTAFGMWLRMQSVIGTTIDSLVENGYLKHRRGADGEIEILKYNED